MTGLREMFDEMAGAPAPPSQLVGDEVYSAGRRRRTRRGVLKGAAAVVAVAVAAGVGSAVVAPWGEPPAPGGDVVTTMDGPLQWAGAADADHLYLAYMACPDGSCPKGVTRLIGSDDGGHTWTERTSALDTNSLLIVDAKTLIADGVEPAVSRDGGRTWSAARRETAAVPAVPDGGAVICWSDTDNRPRELYALDPATGRFAPLATRPGLYPADGGVETVAGHLWVAGTSRAVPDRSAVALSVDGGRTWSTLALPITAGVPELAVDATGRTAYAVVNDPKGSRLVYRLTSDDGEIRTGAGGQLELVRGAATVPYTADHGTATSFVAADGTHTLAESVPGDRSDTTRWWAPEGSGDYRPLPMPGLPGNVYSIRRTAGGWFYTYSASPEDGLFGSTDGRTWSPVTIPGR